MRPKDQDALLAYRDLLRCARRMTGSEADANDLVQDAILICLKRGLGDWSSPTQRPWLRGVLSKRAAFLARTAERRRRREQTEPFESLELKAWAWRADFLSTLPPSLRVLAHLLSADLSALEIQWLLTLSPTAFRARLSALRRRLRSGEEPLARAGVEEPPRWGGPLRAPVLRQLKKLPFRTLATHDPDGHVLFFRLPAHRTGSNGN